MRISFGILSTVPASACGLHSADSVAWCLRARESQQHHLFMLKCRILCAILLICCSRDFFVDVSIHTEKRFAYFYLFRSFYGAVCDAHSTRTLSKMHTLSSPNVFATILSTSKRINYGFYYSKWSQTNCKWYFGRQVVTPKIKNGRSSPITQWLHIFFLIHFSIEWQFRLSHPMVLPFPSIDQRSTVVIDRNLSNLFNVNRKKWKFYVHSWKYDLLLCGSIDPF